MANQTVDQGGLVSQTLGHYRVVEKIGAGGMGEVFRAHDEHLDRDVAIKVLPPGTLSDGSSRKRFRKEALALSKLNHPNIATIYDFDMQQGVDFLVMEYIPGVTLNERLAEGVLPEKEIVALGTQLAEGLSAAHEHGVVHRDLKPGNLRLTTDGRLKILDFGLARLLAPATEEAETESMTQAVVGTLPYMSPEQLRGETVDARSDLWSAGIVLYEMAVGELPFREKVPTATVDAILHQIPPAPRTREKELSAHLEEVILKCLEKEPDNRYQSAKGLAVDLRRIAYTGSAIQAPAPRVRWFWNWRTVAATVLVLAALLIAGGLLFRSRRSQLLKENDTVVLADFVNSTGDPVFDDALKQALTVQLEQSPFLNILPQTKTRDTLRLMGRSPDERLTPEFGRELCQRVGAKALLWGSIARLGSEFVIGLTAAECSTGKHLASEQVQSANKEDVLKVLGKATSHMRSKLGESLSSAQKFDAPIEEATTPSLEALKTYSLGRKALLEKGSLAAIPFYERAIDLDPNFAMAYAGLAAVQSNLNQSIPAKASLEKAFALRDRVSEREKFRISALYYKLVTGEIERSNQTYRLWAENYPLDWMPHHGLGNNLLELGRREEGAAETREALRLNPDISASYFNLALVYLALNQPDVTEATVQQAVLHRVDATSLRFPMYAMAFLRRDTSEMERLVADAGGKEDEPLLLSAHSDTEAYCGRLSKARYFSRRAVESDLRAGSKEGAALWQANAALREAEFGSPALARQGIATALAPTPSWRVRVLAALALARIGDITRAKAMLQEMEKENPSNTQLKVYWVPTIEAAIEMKEGNPARAIAALEEAAPYELADVSPLQMGTLYPAYLRGKAYLLAHDGAAAVAELQKLLDHRGIVLNYPLGALAHLQLGRARILTGDIARAKADYQDFLTLWKDADPDIPILKEAKAEYAKLQ